MATPVNGRKEPTKIERETAASLRINEMKLYLREWYPEAEFWSVFDFGLASLLSAEESFIMGRCVAMVMDCDIIVLDDGWGESNGCLVERFVADQYGKEVYTMQRFRLKEKLKE